MDNFGALLIRVLATATSLGYIVAWLLGEVTIQLFLTFFLLLKDDFLDGGDTLTLLSRLIRTVTLFNLLLLLFFTIVLIVSTPVLFLLC